MKNIFVLRNKLKLSYLNIGKILGILLILSLLSFISYCIIKDFVFMYDDDIYLVGHHIFDNHIYFYDRICDYGVRFLPLQFFDYNILRIFNYNLRYGIIPYYITLKIWLCLFLFVYIIKDFEKFHKVKLNVYFYVFLLSFFIINTFIGAMEVKYSEITQGLFCLLFIYFYQKGYYTNKLKYYILALLSCIYATYMKETMFIPFFVIGVANLLFLRGNKLRNRVNLLLIFNGIIYIIGYYLVYRSCDNKVFYFTLRSFDGDKFTDLLSESATFQFAILLSFIRGFKFLKTKKISFYDSFLFAATGFGIAMYILDFKYNYYYLPSHIFLCVFLISYLPKLSKNIKLIMYIIMVMVIYHYIWYAYGIYIWMFDRRQNTNKFNEDSIYRDVKVFDYAEILVFYKYNDYIYPSQNLNIFWSDNRNDIINEIKNFQKGKEYLIVANIYCHFKDIVNELGGDKYKLEPYDFHSLLYDYKNLEKFVLTVME